MSQIKGKQIQPASLTSSGVLTASSQTVFGQKTFNSNAAPTTAIISFTNLAGTSGFYVTSGSPEGSVIAPVGAMAEDILSGTMYTKASGVGNTGWVALAGLTQLTKASLAGAANTEGRLFWTTDTDELYAGTGATQHRVGPTLYANGVRQSRPIIWTGSVTSTAVTGAWTANYAAAGFTAPPIVVASCNSTVTTTNAQNYVTITSAPTATSVTGRVMQGRNATAGQTTLNLAAVARTVYFVAIGNAT